MSGTEPPSPGGPRTSSLGEVLEADHQRLDRLWDEATAAWTDDRAGSRQRYREFAEGLGRHIVAEEEQLFPFLERTDLPLAPHLVTTLLQEHVEIREALATLLSEVERGAPDLEPAELRLRDLLWAHNAREEGSLYGWLDAPFRVGEGARTADAIQAILAGHPPPDGGPSPVRRG